MWKKLKRATYINTLALALILVANALITTSIVLYNTGQIKSQGPEDPLEAWSEASYIIWKYNSTFYAARNMSTLLIDYSGTNASQVINNVINNLIAAGHIDGTSIHVKGSIHFKAGIFELTSPILIAKSGYNVVFLTIAGEGPAVTQLICAYDPMSYLIQVGDGVNEVSHLTLKDMALLGGLNRLARTGNPDVNSPLTSILYLNTVTDSWFLNLHMGESPGKGIYSPASGGGFWFDNIFIGSNYGTGFDLNQPGTATLKDTRILEVATSTGSGYSLQRSYLINPLAQDTGNAHSAFTLGYGNTLVGGWSYSSKYNMSIGVYMNGNNNTIVGHRVYTTGSGTFQKAYAEETGANNNYVIGGSIEGTFTVQKIDRKGANSRFINIQGFITQNSGNAIISASTSVVVNHGLAGTPTGVWASFNSTVVDGWTWTATSTQITITVTPSGTYTVYWDAEYKP